MYRTYTHKYTTHPDNTHNTYTHERDCVVGRHVAGILSFVLDEGTPLDISQFFSVVFMVSERVIWVSMVMWVVGTSM